MSNKKLVCKHDYKSGGQRFSTGKNILDEVVACTVEDFFCTKCGTVTIKRINEEEKL